MNHIEMNNDLQKMFEDLAKYNILRHDEDKALYKYVSVDTAKIILKNGTIKFSTPHELEDNDFDTSFLNTSVNQEAKNKVTHDLIKSHPLYQNVRHYIENEKGHFNSNLTLSDEEFNNAMIKSYDDQRKNFGIFCLTTDNVSDYMWGKYAKNHTGVCLEFKFPTLFNKLFYTFTIAYNLETNSGSLFNKDTTVNSLTINRLLFTKSKEYEKENEVRMVTEKHAGICKFPLNVLVAIYYGKNTSVEDVEELEQLIKQGGYLFNKGKRISF